MQVPDLLRRYGLHPQKNLGQNFLVDQAALERVVHAAELQSGERVLEIGPGLGSLTCRLAEEAGRVVCVELDPKLLPPLQEALQPYSNVTVIQGDILALDPSELMAEAGQPSPYLVVANIPYTITSALIRHLLESRLPPQRVVLTVQREVAERICAAPGDLSLLALSVQVYGQPQIAAYIPAGAFYPPPKVDSAVIRVKLYPEPVIPKGLLATFFRLAKAGFSQKRKTLRNALSGGMHWPTAQTEQILGEAGIDPMRRAETVRLEEWQRLVEVAERLTP